MATFTDFGNFLKSQRELRGLSRDDVARSTRIPPTIVAALEDGQADRFPELVFVVHHLKAYAQALGLSADEVMNRFHEIPGTLAPTEQSPVALEAARQKSALTVLVVVLVALAVAFAVLYFWTQAQLPQRPLSLPVGDRASKYDDTDSSPLATRRAPGQRAPRGAEPRTIFWALVLRSR